MFEEGAQIFWAVVFGAFIVEAIVEIIKRIEAKERAWQYWASLAVGLGLGVLVAVNYDIDLFAVAGLEGRLPFVGAILTGLIMSRGANVVSDLLGRINAWKVPG